MKLGHFYIHAPDPENPGHYVTHRVIVEIMDDPENDHDQDDGEAEDEG